MISKHHNANFVKNPPRTETTLVGEGKDAVDCHTRSIATWFHLTLLTYERVEFSLCRFNFGPSNPAKFMQPIQQLPKEVESRIIVTSNDDLGKKAAQSLPNWRTRGNCREDGVTRSSGKWRQSLRNSFWRKLLFFSQVTITDRSLPRISPLQSPQSTIDSGACTPPTSLSRANRYSTSPFVENNTQIGRAPRMLDSHNRHAQSPILWNCVQLKQPRHWPENAGSWTLPPTPRADYQKRIKPGAIRKIS